MTVGPVWFGGSIRCEWVPQARGLPRDWLPATQSETWAEHEHFLGRVSAQRHNVEGSHLPLLPLFTLRRNVLPSTDGSETAKSAVQPFL